MTQERIDLTRVYPMLKSHKRDEIGGEHPAVTKHGDTPSLWCYTHDVCGEINPDRTSPAVLVCPGGGYAMTSEREAEAVALPYFAAGYEVFVLRYSATAGHPVPLLEVCGAIAYIRANAASLHVDPDKIAVMGFSAGAHLAASASTLWHLPLISQTLGIEQAAGKPNASILCYPVITSGKFAHRGSFLHLLKDQAEDEALLTLYSLEKQVSEQTPPAFLWHTASDDGVPVENSLLYAAALSEKKIPFELHIFPHGPHGMATADRCSNHPDAAHMIDARVARWMPLSIEWLDGVFGTQQMP